MGLRAGLLSREVRIERHFVERDSVGQPVDRWETLEVVRARVEPLGGRENFGAQQFVATGDTRFTIRYRDDVTVLDRIVYEGRTYDLTAVSEDGNRTALLIVGRARTEERPQT